MRIVTWNVNSLKVRLPHLLDWLAGAQPDVVCLQELKLDNPVFPLAEIEAAGYARKDVDRVVQLLRISEYKRRQSPVGIRITPRGFGKDWRYPITNKYRHRLD